MKTNRYERNEPRRSSLGYLASVLLCLLLVASFVFLGGLLRRPGAEDVLLDAVNQSAAAPTEAPTAAEAAAAPDSAATSETTAAAVPSAPSAPAQTGKEMSVPELLKAVISLKSDLSESMDDLKEGNLELARVKFANISQNITAVRSSVQSSLDAMGSSIPALTRELNNMLGLLELAESAFDSLMQPILTQLVEHPLSGLREGDGFSVQLMFDYLDFVDSIMPQILDLVDTAQTLDFGLLDSDGKMTQLLDTAGQLAQVYRSDPTVLSHLKNVLGAQGDRLYLVAAQNSAEIRASGGFPGAMGTIRISDGVLTVSDFRGVNSVISSVTPASANVTYTESRLFHNGLSVPRDADYCPDHERVASIWALGYEALNQTPVDGVISMTPVIVQKMLAAIDEEIILFDGMVVNGDNAVRALQHDLYFDYFGSQYVNNAMIVTDQLFADAAKKALQKMLENLEPDDLMAYLEIAMESFTDRTLMLWSKDEGEQALIRRLGWDGGLNRDPQKPQAGIYFNCTIASKMGWFLLADNQLGEGRRNEDGSWTYPVTVTLNNDITREEATGAQAYITGGYGGVFMGSAYFFAPAGGKVGNFTTSNGLGIQLDNYNGLDLGFFPGFTVNPGIPVVIQYEITTAPGVDAPVAISSTPTLTAYH